MGVDAAYHKFDSLHISRLEARMFIRCLASHKTAHLSGSWAGLSPTWYQHDERCFHAVVEPVEPPNSALSGWLNPSIRYEKPKWGTHRLQVPYDGSLGLLARMSV